MADRTRNEQDQITILTRAALEEVDMDWTRKKHRRLSFASPMFNLDSIEGEMTKEGVRGGILDPEMDIRFLEFLDCSDNSLIEIDCVQMERGFQNLRILKARKNQLTHGVFHLPELLELNLSHNNLSELPPLKGLKNIETLILAHNKIEGNWLSMEAATRLKRLDLADNLFQLKPSEIETGLVALGKLPLSELRLKDNPFAQFFGEYQIFCLQYLPSLRKLDDAIITKEVRVEAEVSAHKLFGLSTYDQIYNERKKAYDKKVAGMPVPLGMIPTIHSMNRLLEEVIRDPSDSLVMMDHFLQMCSTLAMATQQEHETIFHECPKDDPNVRADLIKGQIRMMCQNIQLVLERHDSAKSIAIRSMAKLCAVSIEGLGDACLAWLGSQMQGGMEMENEVLHAIEEIVLPMLDHKKLAHPTVKVIVRGLAEISREESISEPLGRCMHPLMPRISSWFLETGLNADVISLLAVATTLEDNAKIAQEKGLSQEVAVTLDNRQLVQNETYRGMYLNLLITARNLACLGPTVVDVFAKTELHIKMIAQLKTFIMSDLGLMNVQDLRTCSHLVDAITEMMRHSDDVMKESLESYKVLDLIMLAPKAHTADPMLLSSSLRAIRVVLQNLEMREVYIRDIVEELGSMKPLLPYLGDKKYVTCYNLAEKHHKDYNAKTAVEGQAPILAALSNKLMHRVFVAIIEMIEFFTAETEDPVCRLVSETLDAQGRETALFILLDVPSDDVKNAVMKCIEMVQLDQIQTEEIGYLIKLMNDSKNLAAGKTEEVLKRVIGLLERFVKDDTSIAGQAFLSDHAEVAVHEVFNILTRNEERQTYGNLKEEEEKTVLSLACVSFLRTCGRHQVELRRFLRNAQAQEQLTEILKNEDDLHSPLNPDIIIDRCITGGSVETLLQSFGGVDRLSANKKVAFRATQRIADVLEGRSDLLDGTKDLNSWTFAKREAVMWDDVKSKKILKYLDDDEFEDRSKQQRVFTSSGGFDRLLIYLDGAFESETDKDVQNAEHQKVEKEALDFKYEMDRMAGKIVEEMDLADHQARAQDEPTPLIMDELMGENSRHDTGQVDKSASRKMLMEAMQTPQSSPKKSSVQLFLPLNPDFDIYEDFFEDEESGRVRPGFIVAAVLRCAYVLLTRPVAEGLRKDMIKYFKEAETVRRILLLIPSTGYLNCNVSAKFLRVMSRVLTLPPNVTSEHISTLLLFGMLSNFIKRLCLPALTVMKQTERPLNVHEQVLCTEIARCVEVIGRNIPLIIFSKERQKPQELCVMRCLERFISTTVVSSITQMILYDLQSGSSAGEVIDSDFTKRKIAGKGIGEICSRVLAKHLQHCPPMKYAVLEAFSQAVVFGKQAIRASFMFDLLALLNQGQCAGGVEELLQDIHDRDPEHPERVLRLFECEICTTGARMFRTLIVSNLNLYIMDKPQSSMHCGVCPPEKFCPHGPRLEKTCSYLDICRLSKGYGTQKLVIGWVRSNDKEEFEHIICHRTRDRDLLVEMVHALSAQSPTAELNDRATICGDPLTRLVIQEAVGGDDIFALTYAIREDKDRLSLFVLTVANIYEFKVNFDVWGFDEDLPDSADAEDEIGPQMEDATEHMLDENSKGVDSAMREARLQARERKNIAKGKVSQDQDEEEEKQERSEELAMILKARRERRQNAMHKGYQHRLDLFGKGTFGDLGWSHAQKHEAWLKQMKTTYLQKLVEKPVGEISMIGFMPGDVPVLRLDAGEKMIISFFDDLAREDWRRALACAISQADLGPVWESQCLSPGEALEG